jgi:hypothetical protein
MMQICPGSAIRLFTTRDSLSNSSFPIEAGQRWK